MYPCQVALFPPLAPAPDTWRPLQGLACTHKLRINHLKKKRINHLKKNLVGNIKLPGVCRSQIVFPVILISQVNFQPWATGTRTSQWDRTIYRLGCGLFRAGPQHKPGAGKAAVRGSCHWTNSVRPSQEVCVYSDFVPAEAAVDLIKFKQTRLGKKAVFKSK